MISKYTENQLSLGVWDMWETKKTIPSLKNKEDLDEIYINQSDFELIEGMEWLNYKGLKVTKETPWGCKRSVVMGKPCVTIQEVDYDGILGAKVITNDIELVLWLEDFKANPRQKVVDISKKDIYDINTLEKHGVNFNSTINKEELDKNGYMITNSDHYDNYVYEIYDSRRNTYKHKERINIIEADESTAIFLENWINNHTIKNEWEDLIDWWTPDIEYDIEKFVYKYETLYDKKTYGSELYDTYMKQIGEKHEIPLTICWDIWKILTERKMKEVLKIIDNRWERMSEITGA